MKVFWREKPLDEAEVLLWDEVCAAHEASATRNNISAAAVVCSATGRGEYYAAIASGLLTLGEQHGPIAQTMYFLQVEDLAKGVETCFQHGHRVPGWGNGFYKGVPDELWSRVDKLLRQVWPQWAERLDAVTNALHARGKILFPNPSSYSAVTALILGCPPECGGYVLVAGRLSAWSKLFQQSARRI